MGSVGNVRDLGNDSMTAGVVLGYNAIYKDKKIKRQHSVH